MSRSLQQDVRAVSPIIATIMIVSMTVVMAAAAYMMVIGFQTGNAAPYAIFVGVDQDPYDENTYVMTLGPTSSDVEYADCYLYVGGQMTSATLDQYVGKSNKWVGDGLTLYLMDIAVDGDIDQGDMLIITFSTLSGEELVDAGLLHLPSDAVIASVQFSANGQIDPDLDLFYDFSATSPLSDTTGKHANARIYPTSWTAPFVTSTGGASCFDLDPNTRTLKRYASVANAADLNPTQSIYIEARVFILSAPTAMESGATVVSKGTDYYRIALSGGSGASMNKNFQFSVRLSGVGAKSVNSVTQVQAGHWYTIAGSYDASTGVLSISIDGVVEKSTTIAGNRALLTTSSAVLIGYGGSNRYFNGYIDYVKLIGS